MNGAPTAPPPSRRALLWLFIVAYAVRALYAVAFYGLAGTDGLKGPDSSRYLLVARDFAEAVAAGKVSDWGWLGPDLTLMPVVTWVLTLCGLFAGDYTAIAFVLFQGLFDAGTCLFVAGIARTILPRAALPAGYAAAFTPTFIVLSGLVYTDTLFVFFTTASLYAAVRWLAAPKLRWALLMGAATGLAALVRAWIAPWIPAAGLFLVAVVLLRRGGAAQIRQIVAAGVVVAACLAPVLARNVTLHGAWSLTPQSGQHLAYWVFPLVREFTDGTPRDATIKEMDGRIAARFGQIPSGRPFEDSSRLFMFAADELAKLGWVTIARGWASGAAINLAAPAVVHIPPVSALPRRGFYDTPGSNLWEKLQAFLFGSGNTLYAWLLMLGVLGVVAFRLVQLIGFFTLLRRGVNVAGLLLLAGWFVYVLALNGPVASPKYRLPLEPVLAVLTGAGLSALARRRAPQA